MPDACAAGDGAEHMLRPPNGLRPRSSSPAQGAHQVTPTGAAITTCKRFAATTGILLLFAAVISASPALAARSYDSQISGITEPWGLTIDPSDHLWVSDTGNHGLISEYSAYPSQEVIGTENGHGQFKCGPGGGAYVRSLAFNGLNNHLYVADNCPNHIDDFNTAGNFIPPQWANLGNGGEAYVAIDNSAATTRGRVYVADSLGSEPYGVGYVKAFDPNHHEVTFEGSAPYIEGSRISGPPSGPFGFRGITNIAVDENGDIYVAESITNEVDEFESSGTFVQAFSGAEVPGGFGEVAGIAVDPANENVLIVDHNKGVVDEFSASGAYLGQLTGIGPSQATPFGELNGGIAVNSNGYVYLADTSHGLVDIFTPRAILPTATYGAVTNPSATSETLQATVDPHGGGDVTECHFEYGTDRHYCPRADPVFAQSHLLTLLRAHRSYGDHSRSHQRNDLPLPDRRRQCKWL